MTILKEDAIAAYGTQQALADALGLGRTAVTMWADGKAIPREHELRLRYELKPDVFGDTPVRRTTAATGATAEAVEAVLSEAKERAA